MLQACIILLKSNACVLEVKAIALVPLWIKARESHTLLNDLEAVSFSNLAPLASEKALTGCHHCLAELLFMANMMLKKRRVVLGTPQCIKANMMKGDRLNLKRATATSTQTLAVKEYSMSVLRHISQ